MSDADQDFIAAAMPAFISEAGEQTEAIETLLLELEEQPGNRELLDTLFRCGHNETRCRAVRDCPAALQAQAAGSQWLRSAHRPR